MRFIIIPCLILLPTSTLIAQKHNTDSIYWTALQEYTINLDSIFTDQRNQRLPTIYLQKPDNVDSIPAVINGYHIVLITQANQKKLYKEHGNKLKHTIMSSFKIEDSLLFISIIPFHGTLKGSRHYYLAESDGVTIYFSFDCNSQRFVVSKVHNWGI